MGADQQFCLRWNNFHTNITSAFESLRDDEDFVDITLACEGRQIKAHKMVLSACSPYFRSLLRGNPCQHPIVFLKDVSFANLSSILDFMYHGEVNVSHNELATFLKTAEALRVRGLAEDDNKRDGDSCTEPSSPPPPRDPPEPCSPGRPEDSDRGSDHSQLPDVQPFKRRRSGSIADDAGGGGGGGSTATAAATAATAEVLPDNVKNEPEEYINEDEDMLAQQQQQQQQQQQPQQQHLSSEDIKMDGFSSSTEDAGSDYLSAGAGSGEPSRTNTTMQQLQDTFSPFIPGITVQSSAASSFLSHSASVSSAEHGRAHPSFSLEGVTGLPAGISALPGPSLPPSGGGGQDSSAQERSSVSSTAVATVAATNLLEDGLQMPSCVEYHGYGSNSNDVAVLPSSQYAPSSSGFHAANSGVDGRGKFVCPYCMKPLSTSHGLRRHVSDKHTVHMHAYTCNLCGRNYKTPNSLQNHTYVYHKRRDCNQRLAT